ncbi:MAG: polyphosphate polymerase domain-containing protein [Ruminococcaceae bacterium]|nr:polyphosphate polymerase domain-containing protein [Oscillospiraceae bacterium]
MKLQTVFKRYEYKYLVTEEQASAVLDGMRGKLVPDKWGKSTVVSLYYDTPSYALIRRSVEKPIYKEKLRLRSYGRAESDSTVFLEIKKKYKSVVYKRRISLACSEAEAYMNGGEIEHKTQISHEIDSFKRIYSPLVPAVYVSSEREAFYGDGDFRITFDRNILCRDTDLTLKSDSYGTAILPEGKILMEIKTGRAIPLELSKILTENKIYRTSFSKYGTFYIKGGLYKKCLKDCLIRS